MIFFISDFHINALSFWKNDDQIPSLSRIEVFLNIKPDLCLSYGIKFQGFIPTLISVAMAGQVVIRNLVSRVSVLEKSVIDESFA